MTSIAAARPGPNNGHEPVTSGHAQSHPYTCNSCQVAFRNSELQRAHMRTDWHRYNLKRRVASLPPLSSEIFAEKVLNAQANSTAAAAKASFERICTACQKTYYSENAYQNHLGSQKHKLRAVAQAKGGDEEETASVMSSTISLGDSMSIEATEVPSETPSEPIDKEAEAEFSTVMQGIKGSSISDPPVTRRPERPHHPDLERRTEEVVSLPHTDSKGSTTPSSVFHEVIEGQASLKRCLFCNYDSPTFKLSMMHMTKYHSMFIPEQTYLVNLEGLISWLHSRIHELHECLYCHKIRASTEAVQTHMRDAGHCKIAFEEEEDMIEVGQFYDFSSTYSDPEEDENEDEGDHARDSGGVRLLNGGEGKVLRMVVSDDNGEEVEMADGEENGEGWETDSSASSVDSDELTAIPIDRRHMYSQDRLQNHRHHSHDDPRRHRTVDGFHSHAHQSNHAAFYSNHELHLPSGRTAGHRSLNRYFRQNLHNHPSPAERAHQQLLLEGSAVDSAEGSPSPSSPPQSSQSLQTTRRRNDALSLTGISETTRRQIQAVEKRNIRRAQMHERRYEWGVNKRANSQKHFRDPLLQ